MWKDLRYRTTETWLDESGDAVPPVHALLRRRQHEVLGHGDVSPAARGLLGDASTLDGISPAWPIDYETLAPYYDRAERMYDVHGEAGGDPTEGPRGPYPYPPVPHSRVVGAIVEQLKAQGLHPSPLPLGLRDNCILCNTCNSFPCKIHAKSDAEVCGDPPGDRSTRT